MSVALRYLDKEHLSVVKCCAT